MKVPYLKSAQEIMILVWPLAGSSSAPSATIQLGEKVIEYRYSVNLPKDRVYALFIELLMVGEARITEGRNERLTLEDPTDRTTRGQARSLLEDLLGETASRQKAWDPAHPGKK